MNYESRTQNAILALKTRRFQIPIPSYGSNNTLQYAAQRRHLNLSWRRLIRNEAG